MHPRRRTEAVLAGALAAILGLHMTRIVTNQATTAILGVSAVALLLIHRWITNLSDRLTDVSRERQELAAQTAQARASEMANTTLRTSINAEGAEAERAADKRAAAAEARADARIAEHAAALRREYEENRTVELCQSFEMGALSERAGAHGPEAKEAFADLIILNEHRPPRGAGHASDIKSP